MRSPVPLLRRSPVIDEQVLDRDRARQEPGSSAGDDGTPRTVARSHRRHDRPRRPRRGAAKPQRTSGAQFSPAGYSTLIKRAGQDGVLTITVGQRDDLSRGASEGAAGGIDRCHPPPPVRCGQAGAAGRDQAGDERDRERHEAGCEPAQFRRGATRDSRFAQGRRLERGDPARLCQGLSIRGIGRGALGDVGREDFDTRPPDRGRPLRSDHHRRQDHRPGMGDRARADPAAARTEPGDIARRHRSRPRQFRAPDALDRGARGRFLEDPPDAASSSCERQIASGASQHLASYDSLPRARCHSGQSGRSKCWKPTFNRMRTGSATTDSR